MLLNFDYIEDFQQIDPVKLGFNDAYFEDMQMD